MRIWISYIDRITIENKRSACIDQRLDEHSDHFLDWYHSFGYSVISQTVIISVQPLFTIVILKGIFFYLQYFMRIHQIPVFIYVLGGNLKKQIWETDSHPDIFQS